ncbi:ATPase family AAA domain-containing protein 2-like [Stylophora pistillata]|uniref:ATPase family AAA domain-containing protein 2-like n=1 Tax=Stylophora pistillata TaxID=50429 RepID=UPI000C03E398|nr:ATPase family AAA domain-containing protein 2-like [Stylophora pistillata]
MVKTRTNSLVIRTLRSGNGRGKNIGNIEEKVPSSDESGLDSTPFPSGRRRLRSRRGHDGTDKYPKLPACTVPLTRSTCRSESLELLNGSSVHVETRNSLKRGKGERSSKSLPRKDRKKTTETILYKTRRSDRKPRKVYENLNVTMLTDHRYMTAFGNSKSPKKEIERNRLLHDEESESQTEGDEDVVEAPSMYDLIKRKHDQTPTPEKRSSRKRRHEDGDQQEESDNDDDDEDDDDDDDDEEEEEKDIKGYELRKRRMIPNRYIAPPLKSNEKGKRRFHMNVEPRKRGKKSSQYASPVRRVRRPKRKAHHVSSSTSSSDDSDNEKDERKFERRRAKSMAKARGRCLPMNFTMDDAASGIFKERARIGSSLADVDPMNIDRRVMFDAVGGLSKQIRALKEMVLFPLMYPEVFEKFKIAPPRGVLFHGPPGTGKTLVARALANECSQGDKKVAFFMRKGADCLSKWVGESERQLRLLFDQAFSMRPAIIFFDEIDGLAPVRSSRQDQIHSSIVSTLLALMDGLDSRGEIVVIGATNRIDAIDPALRRPGRFDREFQFALPDKNARRSILTIHTRDWEPKLLPSFVSEVADHCVGYCGADIKALCTEAALFALRRRYPQIYSSTRKLLLDVNSIEVTAKDFQKAMTTIIPASQRSVVSPARALSPLMGPLLKKTLTQALEILQKIFPPAHIKTVTESSPGSLMGNSSCSNNRSHNDQRSRMVAILSDEEASSDEDLGPPIFESLPGSSRSERYLRRVQQNSNNVESMEVCHSSFFSWTDGQNKGMSTYRPRLLICGNQGMGQSTHVAPALLHAMEHLTVHCLDLPGLYGVASKTPEEACSQLFREARRTTPCIVYSPHFDALWNATGDSLHATLLSLLQDLPPLVPLLFLVTADRHWNYLPSIMKELFLAETGQVFQVADVTSDERRAFFHSLFLEEAVLQPKCKKSGKDKIVEVLQFAPTPPPPQLSEAELQRARQDEENTIRELRIFLRDVTSKLFQDRRFKEFAKPVDLIEVPDYLEVITEPMDLTTILQKINCHQYSTCAQYLADIDLITSNALKYNPDRDPMDKLIRHRACELSDMAHSEIISQLEPEFEKTCEEIIAARERRGDKSTAAAPAFVFTAPLKQQTANEDQVEKAVLGVSDITFIPESQSQSNSSRQKKKPRRKKAPIYWGKRPSRRKPDVKRKLDSELDQVTQENQVEVNGEQAEVSGEALPEDCGEGSINEESEQDPGVISEKEGDVANHQEEDDDEEEDEEDDVELMENGVASIDGDVVLLESDNLTAEIKSGQLNSGSIFQSSLVSTKRSLENHKLFGGFSSLQNEVTSDACSEDIATESECDKEPAGEDSSNNPLEKEQNKSADYASRGSAVLSEDIKEKLATLLDLLVQATEGASLEMLEGYHSSLQCCIYKQRHKHDKRQLLKDLELMIKGFGQS